MEILEVNYGSTDKKQSGPNTQESERVASLGSMAAMFAHEVANPLTGLSSSLQFVKMQLERKQFHDSRVTAIIEGGMREIQRLSSLLDGFRSLAVPQPLDLKFADLETIIEEVLALEQSVYQVAGITVKLDFEKGLPPIRVDSAKIKQVILNLCKNAVEAMPQGGCLTVKVYRSEAMLIVEISDDGVGVPDGLKIFEMFKTTKLAGSGLGLPLVQQIVSAHKGSVYYTSEPGHGTTFKIFLPCDSGHLILAGNEVSNGTNGWG
jgi:signal transduction histidine kinase